jgi:thioesterase domain-containing protein
MSDFFSRLAALSPRKRELFHQWFKARVAQGGTGARTSEVLVPLRTGGAGRPLFCVHPAGGQVVAYTALASLLGTQRPFYALQSRALDDPREERTRLEEMATEYVAAVREHQPEGPYLLMGWSMGGVIAHAMAWELERQGHTVALLGLVDAHHFTHAAQGGSDPLLGPALALGNDFVARFLALEAAEQQRLRQELQGLEAEERLQRTLAWGRAHRLLSSELLEGTLEVVRRRLALVEQHERVLKAHRPRVVQAPLDIWWASEGLEAGRPVTDWKPYTTGPVREQFLTGNHFDVVRMPACRPLVEQLTERLSSLAGTGSPGGVRALEAESS